MSKRDREAENFPSATRSEASIGNGSTSEQLAGRSTPLLIVPGAPGPSSVEHICLSGDRLGPTKQADIMAAFCAHADAQRRNAEQVLTSTRVAAAFAAHAAAQEQQQHDKTCPEKLANGAMAAAFAAHADQKRRVAATGGLDGSAHRDVVAAFEAHERAKQAQGPHDKVASEAQALLDAALADAKAEAEATELAQIGLNAASQAGLIAPATPPAPQMLVPNAQPPVMPPMPSGAMALPVVPSPAMPQPVLPPLVMPPPVMPPPVMPLSIMPPPVMPSPVIPLPVTQPFALPTMSPLMTQSPHAWQPDPMGGMAPWLMPNSYTSMGQSMAHPLHMQESGYGMFCGTEAQAGAMNACGGASWGGAGAVGVYDATCGGQNRGQASVTPGSHAAQAIERNTTVCDVSEHDAGYNWTVGCDTQQGIPLN